MCDRYLMDRQTDGVGSWLKGNEPEPILMPVVAVQCACGAWHVRTPTGRRWVEAEKVA